MKIKQKKTIKIFKILFCIIIMAVILQSLFVNGEKNYSYKDYEYKNEAVENQWLGLGNCKKVEQKFIARGNILNNIGLYITENTGKINVEIYNGSSEIITSSEIDLSNYNSNSWNKLGITCLKFIRGEEYTLVISSNMDLNGLCLNSGGAPIIFKDCVTDGTSRSETLGADIYFTYKYLTLGSVAEETFKSVFFLLLGLILCVGIMNIEKLVSVYHSSKTTQGFAYALFGAGSLLTLFNPLDEMRTTVTEFKRVFGAGVVAGFDISKEVQNFSKWFLIFASSFVIFYLIANYLQNKRKSRENKKLIDFLNEFMVLADCCLIFKMITFFADEEAKESTYYFSQYIIILVIIACLLYALFHLDKCINTTEYLKVQLIGTVVSYIVAVFIGFELSDGRVFLEIEAIASIIVAIFCKFGKNLFRTNTYKRASTAYVIVMAGIPLFTSLYIELIHVLNQRKVFVARPERFYKIGILIVIVVTILASIIFLVKKIKIENWKTWTYSVLILGISCLSVQIPITSQYSPHIFEGANSGILISDFLNYGDIPLLEHYGGHMMTNVWEGILYGLINNDFSGAVVSPYSGLLTPLVVILLFFILKSIIGEEIAFGAVMLFPLLGSWSYYGLGGLICLAAISYVKKGGLARAVLLWATVAWCVVYRLDLGVAYGIALVISLIIYAAITKKRQIFKENVLSILIWGISGGLLWCTLALIKGIDPIARLKEFLMISMSNLNWAYAGSGDIGSTSYAWCYLILPCIVAICLVYTVFSKSLRKNIGEEKWLLLLMLGWAYFGNFSRGLVRHSLVEGISGTITWSGYIFIAIFLCTFLKKKILFLPVFMVLILCNNQFAHGNNFEELSIADNAVSSSEPIIESWKKTRFSDEEYDEEKYQQDQSIAESGVISGNEILSDRTMTYWEKLKYNQEVVNRVELDNDFKEYVAKYTSVLNALLDEDETFIDFMNKSLLYSLLGKEDPVYVSQSPLQLSGEFTQEEFIKEIEGVPIVLMSLDENDWCASTTLDGITNTYKYYKIAEYIYENYVPLCKEDGLFAIWCLKDEYGEYRERISKLVDGNEYMLDVATNNEIVRDNIETLQTSDGVLHLKSLGEDPKLVDLQNLIDTSLYIDRNMQLCVEYSTDIQGDMEIYYTTEENEAYNNEKVISVEYYGAAEPPVRCGESHLSGLTEPPHFVY